MKKRVVIILLVALLVALTVPDVSRRVISIDAEPALLLGIPDFSLSKDERLNIIRDQLAKGFATQVQPMAWAKLQERNIRNYLYVKDREDLLVEMVTGSSMDITHEYILEFGLKVEFDTDIVPFVPNYLPDESAPAPAAAHQGVPLPPSPGSGACLKNPWANPRELNCGGQ